VTVFPHHTHSLWDLVFPGRHICEQLEKIMTQNEDLNEAISQLGVDIGEATDRIEAKLADGNTDLTDEIATLRGFSTSVDALAADAAEPPVDPPADPVEGGDVPQP
jgi:hypothetical protein